LSRLGCGAFIGSLWPVADDVALLFAAAFYERMAAGVALGEAMRQAREEVRKQRPADPTWLAYCCFGGPLARREPGPVGQQRATGQLGV